MSVLNLENDQKGLIRGTYKKAYQGYVERFTLSIWDIEKFVSGGTSDKAYWGLAQIFIL